MQLSIEGDVVVDAFALQADDGRTWERLDGELPAAPPCLLTTMHQSSGVCIRGQTSCPSAA